MNKLIFHQDVYTFQIDFAHHVSNIVYIEWMEICRLKLLDHIGLPVKELEKRDISPVLVSTEINYKKPLFIHDYVKIEIWISKLLNASAEMRFNFFNSNGELVATGKQKGLFIKMSTRKPYRITFEERAAFEKIMIKE